MTKIMKKLKLIILNCLNKFKTRLRLKKILKTLRREGLVFDGDEEIFFE